MLTIGIDLDGVISDFTGSARKVLKELFNGRPDDTLVQTSWAFDSLGITPEEENIMWRKIDSIPDWWLTHDPMPETSLLKPLCDKHRVIFITNRKDGEGLTVDKQSAEWLVRTFHIFHPTVLLSSDKGPLAKALKLDYFIDDRPKNVAEVVSAHLACRTYLYDATYNQEFGFPLRVKSFNEFAIPLLKDVVQKRVYANNWSR